MASVPAPARLHLGARPLVRSPLARFVARRLVSLVAVLFAITVLTFLIFQAIPGGDPAVRMAGRLATPQQVADVRRQWGFDKPIYVQYARTMEKILDGSVISYSQQVNVEQEIVRDLPPTISLALGAGVLWLVFGMLFGLLSAVYAGRWLDRLLSALALAGISMPVFFLGAIMLYWFGYKWGLLPLGGYVPLTQDPWGWFTHMLMPWIALSVVSIGVYSRVLRANLLDVMSEDYVRTARAKGLDESTVVYRHALRNAMIPVITVLGLQFGALLAGAIVTETIFSWPGIGRLTIQAISNRDYYLVQGCILAIGLTYVAVNFLTDLLYSAVNPRIRQ